MNMHDLESIHARCIEVGDCWEWQGAYSGGRNPYVRYKGRGTTVRRAVLDLIGERQKSNLHCVALSTCDNPRCVNPDHLRWATHSEVMRAAGAKGLLSGIVRAAKIAAYKRAATSKLTMEMVRAIRASNEKYADLAARYGVSAGVIESVKNHRNWKEYDNNPFAGLGAR